MRIRYRARQFWHALCSEPTAEQLEQARSLLSTEQMALFMKMQPGEQAHALHVLERLRVADEDHSELFVAALLHDCGKICLPLRPWERVIIVLARAVCPDLVARWGAWRGAGDPGWRRSFVAAEQHAAWGAQLARQAGVSPLAEELVLRHQTPAPQDSASLEDVLLRKLQAEDDES
ncbi:MAG: hypothetical protein JW726_08480 [Anaerolineales bacterium]|nr:hypothetical protein [Anaerolineales bacterium]